MAQLPTGALAAVVFDFGGVVQRPAQTDRHALVAKHLHLSPQCVRAHLKEAQKVLKRGHVDEDDFWRDFARRHGGSVDNEAQWANTLAAHYLAPGINREVLALAGKLAKRGVVTALCSNTVASRAALNQRRGAYTPFWPRILSCEVGATKPEKAIFEALLQQTGIAPQGHLLVDDKAANVAAAEAMGMRGHVFTRLDVLTQALSELLKGR